MEIKLEAVEQVMELAGVDYYTAKEALVNAEGDIDKALENNEFDQAKQLLDEAEDCLYEPWRAGPINLEYIYSVSTKT